MIDGAMFKAVQERAQGLRYGSFAYLDFEDALGSDVVCDEARHVLWIDRGSTPALVHFAVDDFDRLIGDLDAMEPALEIRFVPHEYESALARIGFAEWAEYVDFFLDDLRAAPIDSAHGVAPSVAVDRLRAGEAEAASRVSRACALRSRGFLGESAEWFADWLARGDVIALRLGGDIVGYACVAIYNEGRNLWIREIAVDPACQGRGYGARLMAQAIAYGIDSAATRGFLAADVRNAGAIRLYERFGFRRGPDAGELQMRRARRS